MSVSVVWFREDLRVSDQPALLAAVQRGNPVICLYILDTGGASDWSLGAASKWWLHFALLDLAEQLRERGASLLIRKGDSERILNEVIDNYEVDAVFLNRRYEPAIARRDAVIKAALVARGVSVESFNSALLFEPWEIRSKTGTAYKVYTPFFKMALSKGLPEVKGSVRRMSGVRLKADANEGVEALGLLPMVPWDEGFYEEWNPTRNGAEIELGCFLEKTVSGYARTRDIPSLKGTSRMSPYLHFGQIGPREIVNRLSVGGEGSGEHVYLKELLWREFAYHVLFHFPDTPQKPLQKRFEAFAWRGDEMDLDAWKRGKTGYPIVDAGMRELWATGWMHNRVRMIVGSFLVKHLLLPWNQGARWFWECLVDADLASNTLGWQWIGGCGADAAPYFRIFNPMIQGAKFDPDGDYVRKWVPELKALPTKHLHAPWEATDSELSAAGIELGADYPHRIIEHKAGRDRALATFRCLKEHAG